jgi:hypothetical protein
LLLIIAFAFIETPHCSIYLSVPQQGDWAIYSIRTSYDTNATEEDIHSIVQYYKDLNNTEWTFQVKRLSFPQIKFSIEMDFGNGTILTETYEGSIITGYNELNMWIIQGDRDVNDKIYEGDAADIPIISEKIVGKVANATRKLVHAPFTKEENWGEDIFPIHYDSFWDRETGILCRMFSGLIYEGAFFLYITTDITIVETNLWTQTDSGSVDFTWDIIAAIILLFLVLVVALLTLNRKKTKKRKRKSIKTLLSETWSNLFKYGFQKK